MREEIVGISKIIYDVHCEYFHLCMSWHLKSIQNDPNLQHKSLQSTETTAK